METLFIKLDAGTPELAQWVVIDEAGKPHAATRQGALSEIRDFARQRRIVCAIPASDIHLDSTVLPSGGNRKKLQQAAPFALEEDLAEDLDELHFALGREQKIVTTAGPAQTDIPVAVIRKNQLQQYLDRLADAGIRPHAIVPDVLTIPRQDDEWGVWIAGETALVRTRLQSGFACDLENLPLLLNTALGETGDGATPARIKIWNYNGVIPDLNLDEGIALENIQPEGPEVGTLARGYSKDAQLNLLQGPFSFQQEYGKLLKPWRLPAILLGTLILVMLSGNIVESYRLNQQIEELTQAQTDAYREVFPDARNVPQPRPQMEAKLRELGGASGAGSPFLKLLSHIGSELGTNPGIKISSLNFSNDRLDVELSVPELAVLDILKQQLDQQPDISTEIQSASTEGQQVTGRIRISPR